MKKHTPENSVLKGLALKCEGLSNQIRYQQFMNAATWSRNLPDSERTAIISFLQESLAIAQELEKVRMNEADQKAKDGSADYPQAMQAVFKQMGEVSAIVKLMSLVELTSQSTLKNYPAYDN